MAEFYINYHLSEAITPETLSTMQTQITATTTRRADGWAAALHHPNGGRQVFSQRFGTMDDAQKEANRLLRVRLCFPECVIADPAPHAVQALISLT